MKYGIIANTRKNLFWEKFPAVLNWLQERKISFILSDKINGNKHLPEHQYPSAPETELPKQCDMIIAFGGDGTMLHATQISAPQNTPILGINIGGLGFLTETPLENFETIFDDILHQSYTIESRIMVECRIDGEKKPLYALNEIVIDKSSAVRVIEIAIQVNGRYLNTYIADGMLISTPTGSTGYSLSAAGPIVVPTTEVLILNPLCPHSLTNRPVIIPDDVTIEALVHTESPEITIASDGQDVRHCGHRTKMTIRKAPFCARLVKHTESDFFALLRNKLHWGEDFRNKTRWSYDSKG